MSLIQLTDRYECGIQDFFFVHLTTNMVIMIEHLMTREYVNVLYCSVESTRLFISFSIMKSQEICTNENNEPRTCDEITIKDFRIQQDRM